MSAPPIILSPREEGRQEIAAGVAETSDACWVETMESDRATCHVVDALGAIAMAICNLAESVDAHTGGA